MKNLQSDIFGQINDVKLGLSPAQIQALRSKGKGGLFESGYGGVPNPLETELTLPTNASYNKLNKSGNNNEQQYMTRNTFAWLQDQVEGMADLIQMVSDNIFFDWCIRIEHDYTPES